MPVRSNPRKQTSSDERLVDQEPDSWIIFEKIRKRTHIKRASVRIVRIDDNCERRLVGKIQFLKIVLKLFVWSKPCFSVLFGDFRE